MIHFVLSMTILALTHIFCLAAITERKYSAGRTAIVYAAFGVLFVGLTVTVSLISGLNSPNTVLAAFASTITVSFLMFMLTSADSVCKKIFLFISHANIFCIFFCISVLLCGFLFPALSGTGVLYARNIIRTLLYVTAILAYLRFLRPYVRLVPGTKKRTWYSISLVSMLFLLVFASFVSIFYTRYDQAGQYVFLFFAVVIIYCSVLWVIFGTIQHMSMESRLELIGKNVEYLQGQLDLAKENELTARTIRHDFRHHNQNLAVLLKKGDIKEALRYIEQYDESIDSAKPREFCLNATVNAILSNFFIRAQKDGISISVSADTSEDSCVADMDFVAILSNLLENALNGCKECGSRGEIRVNIRTVADKTVIVCSNPCIPHLAVKNNMIEKKGTGIESIAMAAKKYDGDICYKLENGYLTACIILNA